MAAGFFFGGMADGFKAAEELALKRQGEGRLGEELALRKQTIANAEQRELFSRADKQIGDTMGSVATLIQEGIKAGKDPEIISKAIQPALESAKSLAAKAGRDPSQLDVQARVWMATPDNTAEPSKVVKIRSTAAGDEYGLQVGNKVFDKDGNVVLSSEKRTSGQPALTPAETIAPRQVQVANASTTGIPRIDEAFSALSPPQQVAQAQAPTQPTVPQTPIEKRRRFIAEQALLGNADAMKGFGYGKAAAAERIAIQEIMAQIAEERGLSAEDVNANSATYKAMTRGAQALGLRLGNISGSLEIAKATLPRALEASEKVDRTKYPDINRIIIAAKERTGDESVVKLGIALQTFILAYARAQGAGNAMLTDSARQEAHSLLQRAWGHGQIKAGLDQMMIELRAEEEGSASAVESFRSKFKGGPKTETPAAPAPPKMQDPLGIR